MAPRSSTLAWKIPWAEEPGGLQSMGSLRVGHDWASSLSLFTFMHWRRKWQPLQCSCLENPGDGGAWWAAVYGVTQSWTRLKRLSSSSSNYILHMVISFHVSLSIHLTLSFPVPMSISLFSMSVSPLLPYKLRDPEHTGSCLIEAFRSHGTRRCHLTLQFTKVKAVHILPSTFFFRSVVHHLSGRCLVIGTQKFGSPRKGGVWHAFCGREFLYREIHFLCF